MPARSARKTPWIPLLLVGVFAIWLRLPGISAGLPYFYAEDEAHHFNRTVEMTKEMRFDPEYFHKPSLHFYLRMPIVALSYLWTVQQGHIGSIREIETGNSFGLSGYAFTASHPGIVKWNRAFSVLLSLVTIAFTFLLCQKVSTSNAPGIFAALLVAISPEFLENSHIVGVDMLMACLCVIAAYAAIQVFESYSRTRLAVTALICGLAVSSKYNALPIAILPFAVCVARSEYNRKDLAIALLVPALGFFLGSPYILLSFALFYEHLSYEIWHYGVAGHEGHMADPGVAQALFYARWLVTDGIGWGAAILAPFGFLTYWSMRKKQFAIFALYPVLFAALMIAQKANFTRNMVSLIPFAAILSAVGLELLCAQIRSKRGVLFWAMVPFLCAQPLLRTLNYLSQIQSAPESRKVATEWLEQNRASLGNTAISGRLQFPIPVYRAPLTSRVDTEKFSALDLYQSGFDSVIAGPEFVVPAEDLPLLSVIRTFEGDDTRQRIIQNPRITAWRMNPAEANRQLLARYQDKKDLPSLTVTQPSQGELSCISAQGENLRRPGEDYCWLRSRFTTLYLSPPPDSMSADHMLMLSFEAMSPWVNQSLEVQSNTSLEPVKLSSDPGTWTTVRIPISSKSLRDANGIPFRIAVVQSPASSGGSPDQRRLGVALRHVEIAAR